MNEAFWKEHLERIVDAIPSGVVVMDRDGRLMYANAEAQKILGVPHDEIVKRAFSNPAWKTTTLSRSPLSDKGLPFTQVLATGKPLYDVELAITRPDGTGVALSVNAEPVRDGSGAILGLVTSFTDITERKRIEALRMESEERYRRLVELSPDPVVVHSEGKIVYINPAGVGLLNATSPEDVVGKPVLDFVHPDYIDVVRERLAQMQRGAPVGLIEEKFIRLDGEPLDVEVAASPITYQGKPAILVIARDITERKQAEERLKESERRFRDMLEGAKLITVMLDAHGKVTFVNDFLLGLTGWRKEEVIQQDWFDVFIPDEQREAVKQVFFAAIASGDVAAHLENDIVTRWGARRTISFSNVVLRDPQGAVIGTASIGEDVTEQKRLLNELSSLSQITDVAVSTLDLPQLLDSLLKRLVEVMEADTAVILLKEGNRLLARASAGIEEEVRQAYSIKIGHGFAGSIAKTAKPLYVADVQTDPRVTNQLIRQRGIRSMLGVPMMRNGNLIGVLHIGWLSEHPKSDSELHLLEVAADRCAMVITNAQLHEETKESARLIDALNNINVLLNSTVDFDEIMRQVVEESAKAMGCETAAVDLREGNHWVVRYLYGLPQELIGTRFTDKQAPHTALAAKTKRAVVIDDVSNDTRVNREAMEEYNLRSIMVVPLEVQGTVVGALFFGFHSRPVAFSDAQVDFASKLGGAVSLALENARRFAVGRNVADTLCETLLTVPEKVPGIGIGHLYRPATEAVEIGGDFCDIFEIEHGKVGIVAGNAPSKGIGAAALATAVKNTIKARAYEDDTPASVVEKTNDMVLKISPSSGSVAVFFGVLDTATGRLAYCSAGHPPALIKRSTSEVEMLTRNSPPLGSFSRLRYKNGKGTLRKGDTLILYTEGLTTVRCKGELFSEEKLISVVKHIDVSSARKLPYAIFNEVVRCSEGKLADNVAILAVSFGDEGPAETP